MALPELWQDSVDNILQHLKALRANDPTKDYCDGPCNVGDGNELMMSVLLFDTGSATLSSAQRNDYFPSIINPLFWQAKEIRICGFASNTTNANWSHAQNQGLALARANAVYAQLVPHLADGSMDMTVESSYCGEVGDEGDENAYGRFALLVMGFA